MTKKPHPQDIEFMRLLSTLSNEDKFKFFDYLEAVQAEEDGIEHSINVKIIQKPLTPNAR